MVISSYIHEDKEAHVYIHWKGNYLELEEIIPWKIHGRYYNFAKLLLHLLNLSTIAYK